MTKVLLVVLTTIVPSYNTLPTQTPTAETGLECMPRPVVTDIGPIYKTIFPARNFLRNQCSGGNSDDPATIRNFMCVPVKKRKVGSDLFTLFF